MVAACALAAGEFLTVAVDAQATEPAKGVLVVATDPPGVDVYVDGERVGPSPINKSVLPGDHLVEARRAGVSTSQVVTAIAGQSQVVKLSMTAAVPVPVPAPVPATPPAPAPPNPEPAVDVPDPNAKAPATVGADVGAEHLQAPLLSPTHPRRRSNGAEAGVGFACPSYIFGANKTNVGCGFLVSVVPIDFYFGDVHASLLFGGTGSIGGRVGGSLGSKFLRLGDSLAAMAVRAILDFTAQDVSANLVTSGNTLYCGGGVNCYDGHRGTAIGGDLGIEVDASFALTRLLSLEAKVQGGSFLGSMINGDYSGFLGGPFFRLLVGARL